MVDALPQSTPETKCRGSSPGEARKMLPVDFLRLLKRMCDAEIVEGAIGVYDCTRNSVYNQIRTNIVMFLSEHKQDQDMTTASKKLAEETVLTDAARKQFDNANDLIRHIWQMTREKPSYTMQEAMWVAVHLFTDDYLNKPKVLTEEK